MRNFFSNKKLIIIMVVVIATFGLISASVTLSNKRDQPAFIHQVGNDTIGIVGDVVAYPVNGIKNIGNNVTSLFNTYQENRRLKTRIDDLAQTKAQNGTLKKENHALKKQVKLNKTLTDYHKLSASVISRSPNEWQDYLIINRGSLSGIKKNMPVVSESGLIGRVVEVNKTNSKVSLISTDKSLSNKFAVEVLKKDGNDASGIIGSYDKNDNMLVMTNVTSTTGVKKGQQVVTSGLGGLTPRGLFVGTVAHIKKDDYGLVSSIYIKPATDLNNFTVVTVISRDVEDD
ncbi:rod shape-determining protein MreC [Bombilactobacillus thymidiniphilus]|uniref:Cell shape-determining protein MreC n=1 Tax=Bombilactobacillus thymidiniphilus TaxID=2923363 RepID=A0ABY4PDL4_9LACO|nr:rod shape-determining protein MreC [Bombilactobacillus thymidiniphilus]UQS83825.1 rod shape-determining protein MreC [Bombilactobacillus thymidiniphilus]